MIERTNNEEFQKDFNYVSIDDSLCEVGATYELAVIPIEQQLEKASDPDTILFVPVSRRKNRIRNIRNKIWNRIRNMIRNTNTESVLLTLKIISGIGMIFGSVFLVGSILYEIGRLVILLISAINWNYVLAGFGFVLIVFLLFRLAALKYNSGFRKSYTKDPTSDPGWVGYSKPGKPISAQQSINIVINGSASFSDFQNQKPQ